MTSKEYTHLLESIIDTKSSTGSDIKRIINDIISRSELDDIFVFTITSSDDVDHIIPKNIITNFKNKYLAGIMPISDSVYYNVNFKRNEYQYLTISRDIIKSPRKSQLLDTSNQKSNHIYTSTYDTIKKDPDMISSYYKTKYGMPSKNNKSIIAIFTEDDVMCLGCGAISDERLSDVPDIKTHLHNFICPRCNSKDSPLVTFNKYLNKINTMYREKL